MIFKNKDINSLLKPKTKKEIINNLINVYGNNELVLMDISIRKNILDGVKKAIEINNSIINYNNGYFLKLAIMLNNYDIIKFLIKKGTIINITIIETALYYENKDIIKLINKLKKPDNETRSNK